MELIRVLLDRALMGPYDFGAWPFAAFMSVVIVGTVAYWSYQALSWVVDLVAALLMGDK